MKKTEDSLPLNRVLAIPVLTGLAAALLIMLLGAFLVKLGRVGMDRRRRCRAAVRCAAQPFLVL